VVMQEWRICRVTGEALGELAGGGRGRRGEG
jgi:hypothetical protein